MKRKDIILLLPTFGILLFATLYIAATFYYPGGSQADKNSIGFSWVNNYWCNLLNEKAINGQVNAARPIAFAAMFILCFSFVVFWWVFPRYYISGKSLRNLVTLFGIAGVLISVFLFTRYHDEVINVACLFSMIAIIGIMKQMWTRKDNSLFFIGVLNVILVGVNNYLYYNVALLAYLPLIQKVTFVVFLGWMVMLNFKICKVINRI